MSGLEWTLDRAAAPWAEAMLRACWQGGLALGLAWLLTRALPTLPPPARCWLWRLAYAKLLLSFFCVTPLDLPILPGSWSAERRAWSGESGGERGRAVSSQQSAVSGQWSVVSGQPTASGDSPQDWGGGGADPKAERRRPNADPPTLFLLWLFGVAANGVLFARACVRSRRRRAAFTPVSDPAILSTYGELAAALGVRRPPGLRVSPDTPTPLLTGVIRPVVVLPVELCEAPVQADLRLILAHELAHVKRGDLLWGALPAVAHLLFFFHPVVWLARREWTLAQEIACDELALASTRSPLADYAALLVRVAAGFSESDTLLGVSAAGSYSTLERRLSAMKNIGRSPARPTAVLACAVLALGCAALLPWRVVAQPDPPARNTPAFAVQSPPAGDASGAPSSARREAPRLSSPGSTDADRARESARGQTPVAAGEPADDDAARRDAGLRAARERVAAAEARLKAADENAARMRKDAAQARAARAEYERSKRALLEADAQLKRAGARSRTPAPQDPATREVLRIQLRAAQAAFDAAAQRLQATEAAYKAGVAPASELEQARAALAVAQAEVEVAQARLRDGGSSAAADQVFREQQVKAARARIEAAEAQYKRAADLERAGMTTRQELLESRSALEAARREQALADARLRDFQRRPAGERAPAPALGALGEARLRAARSRYEIGVKSLKEGGDRGLEDLYLWSRRWLDAEVSVAPEPGRAVRAREEHLARMKELRNLVRARQEAGLATGADVAAADYYVAEAEIELQEARHR